MKQPNGSCSQEDSHVAFTESGPSHRQFNAALVMLVKRFRLRTSKISIRTMKEGQLGETGEGRNTLRIKGGILLASPLI